MKWLIKILEFFFKQGSPPAKWGPTKRLSTVAVLCHGGIGDILMCTPAIWAIKSTFPNCRIITVVHHKKKAILKNNPHIDRLLVAKKGIINYYSLYSALRDECPEVALLFHGNDPLIYSLFHLACPGRLAGFITNNPLTFLLSKKLSFDESRHVIENNLHLTNLIGAVSRNQQMHLKFSSDSKANAAELLKSLSGKKRVIGFQLTTNFKGKCWATESFSELGRLLVKEQNIGLAVLGGTADRAKVKMFCREFGKDAAPIITDLETASAVIDQLDVFVTPDTGPMHMALALSRPTVVLFGPTNPKNFGPLTNKAQCIVLHKVTLDRPAIKIQGDLVDRMGKITVDEVYQAVIKLLAQAG